MKRYRFIAFSFVVMALTAFTPVRVFSQQISASAATDTNAILIGDQINLSLKLQIPAGTRFRLPEIADTIVKDIPVISRSKIDTAYSSDKKTMTITQMIRFTSFDSGIYQIPSFPFQYVQNGDASVKTVFSEPLTLVVHTMAVDTTRAIKPIKGPFRIPLTFRELLPWILAGLAVLLIVAVIIYIIRKRRKQQPVFQLRPKVRLKPEETALLELERLKVKKLWQNGKVKDYHTELTDILRKYIEERYGIMAMEKTSAEILYDLETAGAITGGIASRLEEILTMADMVKFAKMQPIPADNEGSMDNAIKFVHDTTPAETQEKQAEGN